MRLSRQVSHPNFCRVYDIDEVDGQPFLSMEFIDGEDLKILLRRIGRLPGDKGVQLAQQLCAGLAAAHDRGVLHCDLKPANMKFARDWVGTESAQTVGWVILTIGVVLGLFNAFRYYKSTTAEMSKD